MYSTFPEINAASTVMQKVVPESLKSQYKLPASSTPQWAESGGLLEGSIVQNNGCQQKECIFSFGNKSETKDAQ